jgi:hypothetical protein
VTRDEIVARVAAVLGIDPDNDEEMEEAGLILFDGMEGAIQGVAERFASTGHEYFVVYSFQKMVDSLTQDGESEEDAIDYLEFNTVGLYAGPGTPAILRDMEDYQ